MYENTATLLYEIYEMYKKYKLEDIWDSMIFVKESKASHLLAKDLPSWYDSRNTWEPISAV